MDSTHTHPARAVAVTDLILNEINNNTIDIESVKTIVREKGVPEEEGCLRSLVWQLLLGYLPARREEWRETIKAKSIEYSKFCHDLILDMQAIETTIPENELEDESGLARQQIGAQDHPLSTTTDSRWRVYFEDMDMKAQINRDIERTHPDINFFSGTYPDGMDHREKMNRALFIYYKLNPGIKYVQGMNELYGTLYYVIGSVKSRNSVDDGLMEAFQGDPEVAAFYCFVDLMSDFRDNFCHQLDKSQVGIAGIMQKLSFNLKSYDPLLWNHLENDLKIVPQLYAFRWVTTILTQEFSLPEVIVVWDRLLSESESKIGYLIRLCTAMVMMQRETLLTSDFAKAMKLLQDYQSLCPDVALLLGYAERIKKFKTIIILDE